MRKKWKMPNVTPILGAAPFETSNGDGLFVWFIPLAEVNYPKGDRYRVCQAIENVGTFFEPDYLYVFKVESSKRGREEVFFVEDVSEAEMVFTAYHAYMPEY